MILVADIGNTTVSFAVIRKNRVRKIWSAKTSSASRVFKKGLKSVLSRIKRYHSDYQAVLICSVVPRATDTVSALLYKTFSRKPRVIGKNIKTPIKNLYRSPGQVGQDRLVCAYAAWKLYGAPCIVVDFGTAITFDVVSKKGEYLGGAIIPGLRLYAESLFEKTALLPKVKIRRPREIIGRDTQNSILSGIFYGYGALCDGMIDRISRQLKSRAPVIATGGYIPLMKEFITKRYRVDRDLIFKGMSLLYQDHQS